MERASQKQRILKALKSRKWVTVPQMMRMGVAKYTNRIFELRADGYVIVNHLKFDRKRRINISAYNLSDPGK